MDSMVDAETELAGFLAKYTPEMEASAREALGKMRAILPPCIEMVYDNYNALVVGFCPTPKPSEAILSLAFMPRWVSVCFLQAEHVEDPLGLLEGSGSVAKHVKLKGGRSLDDPELRALIDSALACAKVPLDGSTGRQLIIKSVSAKQRPRRPSPRH
jgi:hypothetical protein